MNPATEQAVAEAIPHTGACRKDELTGRHVVCYCGANARRNKLLARLRMATPSGYVYLRGNR